ncbi:MAG: hypothetical protein C4535_03210 [Comamonadaceae bacterium]|nr:MAG: hypothetical protein C4535_03210 [Comamonadaceae bacterium]
MRKRVQWLCLIAVWSASSLASAAGFHYTYAFASGYTFSGSFEGIANGNLVTDLTHITSSLNGVPLNGGREMAAWGFVEGSEEAVAGAAVASFDGLYNNFVFADAFLPSSASSSDFFSVVPFQGLAGHPETSNASAGVAGVLLSEYPGGAYSYSAARWHMAPVPEPGMHALMWAGLIVLVARARRQAGKRPSILSTESADNPVENRDHNTTSPGFAGVCQRCGFSARGLRSGRSPLVTI